MDHSIRVLTSHDLHPLQHGLSILLPHLNLVLHRLDLLKSPRKATGFGVVFEIDILDLLQFLLELLSLRVLGILILLRLRQVFTQLQGQLRPIWAA